MRNLILLFCIILFCISQKTIAQPVITFVPVINTGLSSPLDVVCANDGTNRIFIVQRSGTIRVYDDTYNLLNSNFLTINTDITTGGERGLLSLAFHPDYENNRYFFVYYTNGAGGVNIDRFQTLVGNPNQADAATRTNIMSIAKPVVFTNHNGGKLNFGTDGHLYFALGDSGSSGDPGNLSQSGNSLWGKMIRINVDDFTTPPFYTIPIDNPYVSDPTILDEIFSFGLRNPWRWSFDRTTGNVWVADVGQGLREEINHLTQAQSNGANYGWRCYEGTLPYNTAGCLPPLNYVQPVYEYPHNFGTGGFSITGGYVYRGSLYPAMQGYYICVDYVSANGFITNATTFSTTQQTAFPANIAGFGEKENGELLAVSLGGVLYSVGTSTIVPLQLIQWRGSSGNGYNDLGWLTANELQVKQFEIQYSTNGVQFEKAAVVAAKKTNDASYTFRHFTSAKKLYYRLKIINNNEANRYSEIIVINNNQLPNKSLVSYSSSNTITLHVTNADKVAFQLFTNTGQLIVSLHHYRQNQAIGLQHLPTGIYLGKIWINDKLVTEKIIIR